MVKRFKMVEIWRAN